MAPSKLSDPYGQPSTSTTVFYHPYARPSTSSERGQRELWQKEQRGRNADEDDDSDDEIFKMDEAGFLELIMAMKPKLLTIFGRRGFEQIARGDWASIDPTQIIVPAKFNPRQYAFFKKIGHGQQLQIVVNLFKSDVIGYFGKEAYKAMLRGDFNRMMEIAASKGSEYRRVLNDLQGAYEAIKEMVGEPEPN